MRTKRHGVYAIVHVPTGAAYIGASVDVVGRYTWHRHMLRKKRHTSSALQKTWNKTKEPEWIFAMIYDCAIHHLTKYEKQWMKKWPGQLLNDRDAEWKHSEETKLKMKLGRARYLETPGAREDLSRRAKLQHAQGRFS